MDKEGEVAIFKWLINICLTGLFIFLALRGIDDLTGSYKIDETIRSTKKLRIALEKYYELTGNYPELTRLGANTNLHILDYKDKNGKVISFADIYGKNSLDKTYGANNMIASNNVYDIKDFEKGNCQGGWNYNYSEKTGEIHPNLSSDIYGDKINWNKQ